MSLRSFSIAAAVALGATLLAVPSLAASAASGGSLVWSSTYAAPGSYGSLILDDNTLLIAGTDSSQIFAVDRASGQQTVWASGDGLDTPTNMARDAAGNVWLINQYGADSLYEYSSTGQLLGTYGPGILSAYGVAVGSDGTIFVTSFEDHRVRLFGPDGALLDTWGDTAGEATFDNPVGIAVGLDGRVYVADYLESTLKIVDPHGTLIRTVPNVTDAAGVAVTGDGTVLVGHANGINEFDADGDLLSTYGSTGSDTGQFGSLLAAVSVLGNMVSVSDLNNDRVVVLERRTLPQIASTTLTEAQVGIAYSATITSTGSPSPSFSVANGSLPEGLTLDSSSGEIEGTPRTAGTSTFTVAAANPLGTDTIDLYLVVRAAIPAPSTPAPSSPAPSDSEPSVSPAASADVTVLPPARFAVTAPARAVSGGTIRVKASGLRAAEKYTLRIGGANVASGTASGTGTVSKTITVPKSVKAGTRKLALVGGTADRLGTDSVKVSKVRKVVVSVAHDRVEASSRISIVARHLLPGEKVTVVYNGHRVSPKKAEANAAGEYRLKFDSGIRSGQRTLKVTGRYDGRSTPAHITVTPLPG